MSDGAPYIARYNHERYWQVLRVGDMLIHATICSIGSVTVPRLHCTLRSETALSDNHIDAAIRCISCVLNMELDVKPFYSAMKNDVLMTRLIDHLYGLKNIATATVFEALVCSIIEQQISLPTAHSLEHKVTRSLGDSMAVCGVRYYTFPTAQQLAHASVDALRRCGISRQKAAYITEIAETIERGDVDIEKLKQCDDTSAILNALCSLRGVGLWTAELTALRGLNRLDVMPAADCGLERRWIAHYYRNDRPIVPKDVKQIAERWDKWKGLAGYYLITAGRLNIDI